MSDTHDDSPIDENDSTSVSTRFPALGVALRRAATLPTRRVRGAVQGIIRRFPESSRSPRHALSASDSETFSFVMVDDADIAEKTNLGGTAEPPGEHLRIARQFMGMTSPSQPSQAPPGLSDAVVEDSKEAPEFEFWVSRSRSMDEEGELPSRHSAHRRVTSR